MANRSNTEKSSSAQRPPGVGSRIPLLGHRKSQQPTKPTKPAKPNKPPPAPRKQLVKKQPPPKPVITKEQAGIIREQVGERIVLKSNPQNSLHIYNDHEKPADGTAAAPKHDAIDAMYNTESRSRFLQHFCQHDRAYAERCFTTVDEQKSQIQSLLEINTRSQKRIRDVETALHDREAREKEEKKAGLTRAAEADARCKYLEDLNREMTELNGDLDAALTAVNAEFKNMALRFQKLESDNRDAKSREKVLELEHKSREFRLADATRGLNRKIKSLESENRQLRVTLASAREHNAMMRLDLADLEQKTADVEETVAKVRQRDAFLIETNRELRRRLSVLQPDDDAILKRNHIRPVSNDPSSSGSNNAAHVPHPSRHPHPPAITITRANGNGPANLHVNAHARAASDGKILLKNNRRLDMEAPQDLGDLSVWLNAMGKRFEEKVWKPEEINLEAMGNPYVDSETLGDEEYQDSVWKSDVDSDSTYTAASPVDSLRPPGNFI